MYVRILKELYSDGCVKYAAQCRNYRGGFETMALPDGSGWAVFDSYNEAYEFAFPNKTIEPELTYIISTEVVMEDYSDLEY